MCIDFTLLHFTCIKIKDSLPKLTTLSMCDNINAIEGSSGNDNFGIGWIPLGLIINL